MTYAVRDVLTCALTLSIVPLHKELGLHECELASKCKAHSDQVVSFFHSYELESWTSIFLNTTQDPNMNPISDLKNTNWAEKAGSHLDFILQIGDFESQLKSNEVWTVYTVHLHSPSSENWNLTLNLNRNLIFKIDLAILCPNFLRCESQMLLWVKQWNLFLLKLELHAT